MNIRNLVIFVGILFWPLSLFLANTQGNFLTYLLPVLLTLISFLMYKKQWKFYEFPILFIPVVEPKLALFPIIFLIMNLIFAKKEKDKIIFFIISVIILFVFWEPFWGQTIFIPDYEAQQEVIRNSQLYDSVFLARLFHNKGRLIFDKFSFNFFALLDPNNYFFGFHPRQIIGNQNLAKYPFIGIIFILSGFYYMKKNTNGFFIIISLLSALLSLSVLTIFDRNDFLLWVPLSLIYAFGVQNFSKRFKFANFIYIILIIFAIPEIIRIIFF